MSGPVLTALVPVGPHHPDLLRRAIGSLRGQTREDWEALVVADPSQRARIDDALGALLDDPRIRIANQPRPGLAAAYNHGMRESRTDFVAVLLGDDMWAPETVDVLAAHLRAHPDADFLHSGRIFVGADDRPISSPYLPRADVTLETFLRTAPVKHLLCWRRELGLAVGGLDERVRFAPDDFDFPWTMAEHGASFHAVPEPLYLYRDHREGPRLTTHVPRSVQERELRRVFRKHGVPRRLARERIRKARRTHLRQTVYRSRLEREVRKRLGLRPRAGWPETYR